MNQKKTNRLTKLWSVLLLIFSMAAAMSVPAAASDSSSSEDQTDKIFLIMGSDSEDELVSYGAAFIVQNTDGSVFIVTDLSAASEDAVTYSLADFDEMVSYDVEVTGQMTDYSLLTLEFTGSSPSSSRYVTLDYPQQDSIVHCVFFDNDLEASSEQIRLTKASLETIGSTEILTLDGDVLSDDAYSNGVGLELSGLIDDDGNLIGIYSSAGTFFSLMSDAEEFHSEETDAEAEEEAADTADEEMAADMAEEEADADNLAKGLLDDMTSGEETEAEAEAEVPEYLALLVGTDSDDEIVAYSSAVVLDGGDGSLVVMADSSVYTSEAASYQAYIETGSVEVTYAGVRGDTGMALFSADSWSGDPDEDYLVYEAVRASIGESATLLYLDGDLEVKTASITISGSSVLSDGLYGLECENADSIEEMLLEDDSLLPAAIVNADGDCIGVWMPESVDGIYIEAFAEAS
ncbi:MAG: hypothetical protein LIO76_09350 [Clostridiales bacterium]|nr:hypothetical protein [Clostridiales bacterium]